MLRFLMLLCVFVAISFASEARAEKRVALVIGNSAYQNTPEPRTPRTTASAWRPRSGVSASRVEGRDLDKRAM